MQDKLLGIKNQAVSMILEASSQNELNDLKMHFLGRNGEVTLLLKDIAKLPVEKRPEAGRLANEVKTIIEETIKQKTESLSKTYSAKRKTIDVTEPGIRPPLGHLHLVTQAIEEITEIFKRIGFVRVRYPEIEWDWYAFEALNFPENHPARDDWETFFIKQKPHPKKGPVLLTPHTSSGQVREMERHIARNSEIVNLLRKEKETTQKDYPIRIKMLNIAKTYRRQSDISHAPMFHQFEGLVVGEHISIADLKGTLDYFFKAYLGENRKSRIRPYHFQFTEPSFEVDVSCGVCGGKGCKLCKAGWLEIGGAGMVHPNVLRFGGIDPEKYSGYAFGWGVERVVMMKDDINIDDLRMLYTDDLRFLQQF